MKILSVCRDLPTMRFPQCGLFVSRRLEKMTEFADVRALNPQPWFPLLRPRLVNPPISADKLSIDGGDMFYFPGVGKRFDGHWMQRCVQRWLGNLAPTLVAESILDAHFGYPEGVGCCWAAREWGIPAFVTLRGLEVELFDKPSHGPQLVAALKVATGVIAVSHSLKSAAVKAGVPAEHITVIPNGVDSSTYSPGEQLQARQLVNFGPSRKLIVCVGNLKPVKGHDLLIRAIASIDHRVELHLVCIGDGVTSAWGTNLRRLAKRLGVDSRVDFVGSQPPMEVVNWLRSADLFALASRREGCCNAVLEALSTGLPVVVSDVGDNRLLVREPDCGRVVRAEDPEAMGVAIRDCLNTQFDHQKIAESMRNHTWEAVARRVIKTFADKTNITCESMMHGCQS